MIKKDLYKIIYYFIKIRETELSIAKYYSDKKMRCPVHLSVGQESISAALSAIYDKNDYAISNHRCHAHYLSKDCSLYKMISELLGFKDGCSKGIGGSMHLVDEKKNFIGSTAIVANSIPVGAGYAYSLLLKGDKSRVFIFLGDASIESGVFYESINFAIIKNLNITFICENNGYSVYSNFFDRQLKGRKIYKMVSALGVKTKKIKSNNPITIFNKLKNFIKGQNLSFVEIDTYRYLEHCGPNNDDYLNYRPKKEIENWKSIDFNRKIYSDKIIKKHFSSKEIDNIKKKVFQEIHNVFRKAKKGKPLDINQLPKL